MRWSLARPGFNRAARLCPGLRRASAVVKFALAPWFALADESISGITRPHHPLRLEAEGEAALAQAERGRAHARLPVSPLFRVLWAFPCSQRCLGPKRGFAPERTSQRKERPFHASLRARIPGAPGHQSGAGRGADEGIQRRHHRRRRQGRQDRVLGPQDRRLQDQEEPQGPLLAHEPRGSSGGDCRDGAPHGPVARRHPLHHHPRRRARDRALHPDAQERPRRARPRRRSGGGFRGDRGGLPRR